MVRVRAVVWWRSLLVFSFPGEGRSSHSRPKPGPQAKRGQAPSVSEEADGTGRRESPLGGGPVPGGGVLPFHFGLLPVDKGG